MKVKVKRIPVRYNGKTYSKGETFEIVEKYYDENLVSAVEETKKTKPPNKE